MSFIYILFLKYSKPTVKIILKMSMSIAHGEAPSPGADYSSTLSKVINHSYSICNRLSVLPLPFR